MWVVSWTKIVTVGDILGVAQWNFEKLGIKNIKKISFFAKSFFSITFFSDLPFWRNPNFGNFYWFSIDFLLENQVKIITEIWNLHRKIETGRIFERLNRKSVISHKGNSYRSWFECVPHPSKALGKGARRVSATGVSEWLRYCSTLQCGSSLRYCSTLQCGSSLDSVGIAFWVSVPSPDST